MTADPHALAARLALWGTHVTKNCECPDDSAHEMALDMFAAAEWLASAEVERRKWWDPVSDGRFDQVRYVTPWRESEEGE